MVHAKENVSHTKIKRVATRRRKKASLWSGSFYLSPSSPQRHASLKFAGDNIGALVHVLEALRRSLDLTKVTCTEFQGGTPRLAFLLHLPRCLPLSIGRKMTAVAGSIGVTAAAGRQELVEVVHAKE